MYRNKFFLKTVFLLGTGTILYYKYPDIKLACKEYFKTKMTNFYNTKKEAVKNYSN